MKRIRNTFSEWKLLQFGPPQTTRSRADLLCDVKAGEIARELLIELDRYEAQLTAALYAWQIRDKDKS